MVENQLTTKQRMMRLSWTERVTMRKRKRRTACWKNVDQDEADWKRRRLPVVWLQICLEEESKKRRNEVIDAWKQTI
jgi:hypothetical protein